jgi:hypothetical protein
MRKGDNPSKNILLQSGESSHRVIMPLHIPNEEGYYKQAYKIFEMSIISLINTSAYKSKISVISDACCESVNSRLHKLFMENKIDELILEKHNIGKINSILKSLRTVNETFVTISDADVLFLDNWDEEVFTIFKKFPKAAVVSPTPVFRNHMNYTANIWIDNLFSKKLRFQEVKNPEALEKFAQSLGWNSLENRFKDVIATLESRDKSTIAVVGATHFVATYKTAYLKEMPKENSNFKLGGTSEGLYLDQPPFKSDGYRLTTYDNFAYHMGNHLESWLSDEFKKLNEIESKKDINFRVQKNTGKNFIKKIVEKIFLKFISRRSNYNYILRKKGLTKEQLKTFWY